MDTILREIAEKLKHAIEILDKVKVDKKFKSDKEEVLNDLRYSLDKCSEHAEENYNDVGIDRDKRNSAGDVYMDAGGEQYDDVSIGKPSQDNIYDDNLCDAQESYDDIHHGKVIRPTECEALSRPALSDYIELKKERKLLSGAWQKRWCVLQNGILYIYETPKDKQQKEAFEIASYTFQIREDITKESKRKERCFEMRNDSINKVYEFCASDRENVLKWQAVMNMKGGARAGSIPSLATDETYDNYDDLGTPAENDSPKGKPKKGILSSIGLIGKKKNKHETSNEKSADTTYDDTGNSTYDDTQADGMYMEYDDTGNPTEPIPEDDQTYEGYDDVEIQSKRLPPAPIGLSVPGGRPSTKDQRSPLPSPTLSDRSSVKSHTSLPPLPSRDELTGSASGSFNRNRPPMPIPGGKRELPPPPGVKDEPLPPPPIEEPSVEIKEESDADDHGFDSDDYENMYQGMWDCQPHEENELPFKRGEIVHIISREYDSYGWWTAESREEYVGLVPVSYLTKAYDI